MNPQKDPLHINAKKNDIAKIVLMPGDPLRAKYIADKYLENAKLVTSVRNMYGFTGTYKNKEVTIMGSGMGMPSMGIYAFELIYYYNVSKIIRIGTCGVNYPAMEIPSVVLTKRCYSPSNYAYTYDGTTTHIEKPSKLLNDKILEIAKKKDIKLYYGTILTCDQFNPYIDNNKFNRKIPKNIVPIASDMETYALLHIAKKMNCEATSLLTCVDSPFSDKKLSIKEREQSLDEMILLALDSII